MLTGIITALITPFKNGKVDERALCAIVENQIKQGIHGLVVCGTSGEAATMSTDERLIAIRTVVREAKGRVSVIAGTGTNNTRASLEMTAKAADLGVDAALVVTPYYVKPPQRALIEHYCQVCEVGLDIVAYNVPGRTGVSITPETAREFARMEKIIALKEASGDLRLDAEIIKAAGDRMSVLSGDDFTFLPLLSIGGRGVISVVSNVAPALMVQLFDRFEHGDVPGARAIYFRLLSLMRALFLESNPIPVKAAMACLGFCTGEIRSPLCPLADKYVPELKVALTECGLL